MPLCFIPWANGEWCHFALREPDTNGDTCPPPAVKRSPRAGLESGFSTLISRRAIAVSVGFWVTEVHLGANRTILWIFKLSILLARRKDCPKRLFRGNLTYSRENGIYSPWEGLTDQPFQNRDLHGRT